MNLNSCVFSCPTGSNKLKCLYLNLRVQKIDWAEASPINSRPRNMELFNVRAKVNEINVTSRNFPYSNLTLNVLFDCSTCSYALRKTMKSVLKKGGKLRLLTAAELQQKFQTHLAFSDRKQSLNLIIRWMYICSIKLWFSVFRRRRKMESTTSFVSRASIKFAFARFSEMLYFKRNLET